MGRDQEKSLGDQESIVGGKSNSAEDTGQHSLGDAETFVGSPLQTPDRSLGDDFTFGVEKSNASVVDDHIEIVDLAARYRIEKQLGKGGMGEVLLATDTRLDRRVAIKRILGDSARSRTAVNRFLTEAKSIAALNHPNVVQIYDYGREAKGPFLIMEYVDGSSLLDRCRDGAIPLEEAIELACQLCDGLSRAHEAGIIHRDIKPANVLLTRDGIPKLTDFGLAKAETADTGMTMAGAVLGTLDFMPPEQRRDAALTDARSDLWSLAATLYQMVTGRSPKIIKFNDVPKALQEVLGKALEDRKEDRYQTAKELKEALRESLAASTEVDLEVGECPHCGTKNETNRKFCKKCAKSLEVACLSCSTKISMWEEVCGHCGAQQSELVEQRKRSMAEQREKAERLLEKLEFQQAIQLASGLGNESDLRLQHQKAWSQKFLKQVENKSQEQLARLSELVSEALKHEQAHDYSSAIHTLEQVPEALKSQSIKTLQGMTAAKLLKRVQDKKQESQRLEKLIRQRVSARQVNGLQTEVDKFLTLSPKHPEMLKLKQQLLDREAKLISTRDAAYAAAKAHMTARDYQGAVTELSRIAPSVMQPEIEQLKQQATENWTRLQALQKSIASAVEQKRYHGLLLEVEELLELKPDDAAMISLQSQLIAREEKNATQIEQIVLRAQKLRQNCRFQQAQQELSRIPKELQTRQVIDLLRDCEEMALRRQQTMAALSEGLSSQNYDLAISIANKYHKRIAQTAIHDEQFLSQYQACLQGNAEQQRRAKAATKRKDNLRIRVNAAKTIFIRISWALHLITGLSLCYVAMEREQGDLGGIYLLFFAFTFFAIFVAIVADGDSGTVMTVLSLLWIPIIISWLIFYLMQMYPSLHL
jgi:serine/threonine protein kinase